MKIINHLFWTGLLLIVSQSCSAQQGLNVSKVYLYNNGYAWVISDGKVKLNNGNWKIREDEIPSAVKGSFWFESSAGVNYIVRNTDTVMRTVFQPNIAEMIRLNLGRDAKFLLSTGNNTMQLEGKIKRVFYTPDDSTQPEMYSNPAIAVIQTASGDVVLYKENLNRIIYSDFGTDAKYDLKKKGTSENLVVNMKEKTASAELKMAYLTQHPGWDPVYRLSLSNNGKAMLTFGAELSNLQTDLKNAEINLVVGQPSFSYAYLLSRLSSYKTNYTTPSPGYSRPDDSWEDIDGAAPASKNIRSTPVEISSAQSGDFYLYTIKNFSLQKGQSAYIQILNEAVNTEHTYECALLPVTMYGSSYSTNAEDAPLNPVYHYIRFQNPAKQNLAPGAVLVENQLQGTGVAQGQPRMEMVPVGGKAKILLSQNPDLVVKVTEEESSRTPNAHQIVNRNETLNFDQVEMKVSVHLENQGTETRTIHMTRVIEGKGLKSALPWTLVARKPAAGSPNNSTEITWDITLKPGEKQDFVWSYQYYLRVY